ncbi:MAG: sensor domain-containing diguanylate cyclase [Luteimonas sp.]
MSDADVADTEAARLAALTDYGILDTLPEKSYDDLVAIAAGICDAPMGSVALIDSERKWFKSQRGFSMSHMARGEAFGAHAIQRPHEILVVPDALADVRFLTNPLVTGEHKVRFYAGAPLVSSSGAAVGTICVMDRTPRDLAPFQREALSGLSRQVVNLLELGLAHRNLSNHLSERDWYERQLLAHQQELIAENAQLTEATRTDVLTGLLNRRAFRGIMQTSIATAVMDCTPLAMAIVDIDHFKVINDRYGHPVGDKTLIAVAHALKAHCGDSNTIARIGGEEFAILFPATDLGNATLQCERLRATIETLPHDFQLTGSIGLAVLRIGDVVGSLYARADEALYVAKHRGRNQVASIA